MHKNTICFIINFTFMNLALCFGSALAIGKYNVQRLTLSKPTQQPIVCPRKFTDSSVLDLYCYEGTMHRSPQALWTSACFEIQSRGNYYEIYSGTNESEVTQLLNTATLNWRFFLFLPSHSICFVPFTSRCIGISTVQHYELQLIIQDVDPWLVGYTVIGVLMFFVAELLSRSVTFYYVMGVLIGVSSSILFVFLLIGRFLTNKFSIVLSFAAGGSLTLWCLQWFLNNLQMAFAAYRNYLLCYLAGSSLLSFGVCYYFGPIENPRLFNLIKWFLQAAAIVLIFNGMQIVEASIALVAILLIHQLLRFLRHTS